MIAEHYAPYRSEIVNIVRFAVALPYAINDALNHYLDMSTHAHYTTTRAKTRSRARITCSDTRIPMMVISLQEM